MEAPKHDADGDDDDKSDDEAAKELELSLDAAGAHVVFGVEVVTPHDEGLDDVDSADGKPADADDQGENKRLADDVFPVIRKAWNAGQNGQGGGEEEDDAGRAGEMALDSPARADLFRTLGLFALEDPEYEEVDDVREEDCSAEKKDGEEPAMQLNAIHA